MTAKASLQEQARALGDPTRHAIFRHLADADRPLGVAELNERFPLNHTAIRQHLAKLVAAGLVVESTAASSGRGRPRLVYELDPAAAGTWGTSGPYERLSPLLLEVIRTGGPPEEVGRRAAGPLRVTPSSGDAVADLAVAMARQGYEPTTVATRGGTDVVLHRCPVATAAATDRETVCSLHLGLADGLLAGSGTSVVELVALDPLDADCRLRLRAGEEGPPAGPATNRLSIRGGARRRPAASP